MFNKSVFLARFNSPIEGVATKFSRLNDMLLFVGLVSLNANYEVYEVFFFKAETCFFVSRASPQFLLRARRNEKELKVKPATSFKYFQYLSTKNLDKVLDKENMI